jgi:hypothetical protein
MAKSQAACERPLKESRYMDIIFFMQIICFLDSVDFCKHFIVFPIGEQPGLIKAITHFDKKMPN